MSDYPKLTEMGIMHPQEIEKFGVYTKSGDVSSDQQDIFYGYLTKP